MKYDDPILLDWMKTARRDDLCPHTICTHCGIQVMRTKHHIQISLAHGTRYIYCSNICMKKDHPRKAIQTTCGNCNTVIKVAHHERANSKSGLNFCSSSCAAIYNNAHKSSGTRRSKLEAFIETKLLELYPDITFVFNGKDVINSELDIYLPQYKLAFELNGIFHYEPIYGADKLSQIQTNDTRKFQACLERGIELCLINTSDQQRFTVKSSQRYLDVICSVVNQRILLESNSKNP